MDRDLVMSEIRNGNGDHGDFSVEMPANSLRRARKKLSEISKDSFRPSELCLSGASASTGGFLAALRSGVDSQSSLWWLFYGVLPAFALAGLVAYLLLKRLSTFQPAALAKDVLEILPDPDQATPIFKESDRLAGTWKLESTTTKSGKKSTGLINFHVMRGRITAGGQIYGESNLAIGDMTSEICDYQSTTKQLVWVYRLSAQNDDGSQVMARCIFSGIFFENGSTDLTSQRLIKGNWFHLQGNPSPDGARPSGSATLTLQPQSESGREEN
jgi:hypothetical protein